MARSIRSRRSGSCPRGGLTLMELVVTLCILVAVASLMIPNGKVAVDNSGDSATRASLLALAKVIANNYVPDMGDIPASPVTIPSPSTRIATSPQLCYLFVNPAYYDMNDGIANDTDSTYNANLSRGWRGPYLMNSFGQYEIRDSQYFFKRYGETGDPTPTDGWRNPIVLHAAESGKARLVSAGPNKVLEIDPTWTNAYAMEYLAAHPEVDDIVLTFHF